MSQELIAMMMFGPERLQQCGPKFKKALKQAEKILAFFQGWDATNSQYETEAFLKNHKSPFDDIDDAVELRELLTGVFDDYKVTAMDVVKEFCEFWNNGTSDSVMRIDPKGQRRDRQRKAVVVGYTDGNSSGRGYDICRIADMMCLWESFNID